MELDKNIADFINTHLLSPSHFLVAVQIKGRENARRKIEVLIDADEGIDIQSIAKYNNLLSAYLDELNPFNTPYDLEVSSPGIDYPLQTHRQFKKNIGRLVECTLETSDIVRGKLLAVDENTVKIEVQTMKKKQPANSYEVELSKASIKKAIVQITF